MAKTAKPYAVDPLVKQPGEDWPFTMPFTRLLGSETIDSVSEVRFFHGTWPLLPTTSQEADPTNPENAVDLKLEGTDHDDELVELRLSGGVHGDDYYLEVDVLTSGGYTRCADGWLLIRDH
jgi:hypothetical protein